MKLSTREMLLRPMWLLLVLWVAFWSTSAGAAEADAAAGGEEEEEAEKSPDRHLAMALSPAAQKTVDKYMNIVLADPRNEYAFQQVYETYESENQTWKLLDFFINAVRLDRANANLQLLLGLTYYRFRDYYKAAEQFRGALDILSKDERLKSSSNRFYCLLMLGQVYLKQANSEKAKEYLAEAVKIASGADDRVNALLFLGEAMMAEGNSEGAQQAWAEVRDEKLGRKYDVPTLQRLARIYRRHELLDKADEMLVETLSVTKKDPQLSCNVHIDRAQLAEAQGNRKGAVEYLRQAQSLLFADSPLRQEVEDRIRRLYGEDDRQDEFFEELEKRVAERPYDVSLRKEIARLYREEERLEKALTHVEAALGKDSSDVPLLEQAVDLYVTLGLAADAESEGATDRLAKAIALLDQLYEVTGEAPVYLVRKGELLWKQEKQDDALATWQRIISVESPSIDRYDALARTYRKHELQDKAIDAYETILGTDPNAQDVRLALAEYLLSLEEKERAAKLLAPLAECYVRNWQLKELVEKTKRPLRWTLEQFGDGAEGELGFDEEAGHAVLSVKTEGKGHGVKAAQKVTLLPHIVYQVSARVKKLAGEGEVMLGIDTPLGTCEVRGKDEWQEVRVPIPSEPERREVEVFLQVVGGPTKVAVEGIRVARPTTPETFLQVAELYAEHEMDSELMALLEEARTRYPKDYRIARRIGSAFERLQEYEKAIESFFEAYDHAPNWRESEALIDKLISLHLAYGVPSHGRGKGGIQGLANLVLHLYKGVKADREDEQPYMGLARISSVSRPTAQTAYRAAPIHVAGLKEYHDGARDLFPMGPMNAVSHYTQALDREPMRLDAYEGLGRSFMLFDEFEKAVVEYKKLSIVNPVGKWKYYFTIGDFFASQGQMPEALAFWNRVAERAFTDATIYFKLGTRYYWAEEFGPAVHAIGKAIELHPEEYRYHLAFGNMLAEMKGFSISKNALRQARKAREPGLPEELLMKLSPIAGRVFTTLSDLRAGVQELAPQQKLADDAWQALLRCVATLGCCTITKESLAVMTKARKQPLPKAVAERVAAVTGRSFRSFADLEKSVRGALSEEEAARYWSALLEQVVARQDYARAIHEYREGLRLSTQTMLLPVRRTMSRVQVQYARQLFTEQRYQEALDVYQEIRRFQEVLNKHLGTVVAGYPDVLVQIVRTNAKLAGQPADRAAYQPVQSEFPDAICWVSDHLSMAIGSFVEQEVSGRFTPRMSFEMARSDKQPPAIKLGFSTRIHPWVLRIASAPARINLQGKYKEAELDPVSGKVLARAERRGFVRYFGDKALRTMSWYEITDGALATLKARRVPDEVLQKLGTVKGQGFVSSDKFQALLAKALSTNEFNQYRRTILALVAKGRLELTEVSTGKTRWQVEGKWSYEYQANAAVAVGLGSRRGAKLQALDLGSGKLLWEAPGCAKFQLSDRYVTLKRVKQLRGTSRGGLTLEEHAHGAGKSVGYIFQVLDARTGEVVFETESTGTHYWRVPVAAGNLVLLTDGFAHIVYAYDIASGKLRWQAEFESFFAAPPMLIDEKIHLYMRRPKLKTIIQYAVDPQNGNILHQTDLKVNSLYARPIPIGPALLFYDPVAYALLCVDRDQGGVMGRFGVEKTLTDVSKRNLVTLEGWDNHIFFYTWDGLIVRLDVGEK